MSELQNPRWQAFIQQFPLLTFRKGEVLLFQGEVPKNAYVLKNGIIKMYNLTEEGSEQLVQLHTPSDIFPVTWLLKKAPSALYYYEALTDCQVYCIPRDKYLDYIKSDLELIYSELERFALKDFGTSLRLNALLQSKASDKILNTLHYLVSSQGSEIKPNLMKINLTLTHQDLANLTGLTRETVAIEINKLKRQGVIHYQKRTIYHIDVSKLNRLLNDQFIAESKITF